jgi:hypothetical protein
MTTTGIAKSFGIGWTGGVLWIHLGVVYPERQSNLLVRHLSNSHDEDVSAPAQIWVWLHALSMKMQMAHRYLSESFPKQQQLDRGSPQMGSMTTQKQ